MAQIILAADLGGTRIKLGIFKNGQLSKQAIIEVQDNKDIQPNLANLSNKWRDLLFESHIQRGNNTWETKDSQLQIDHVAGIALGLPLITLANKAISHNEKYNNAVDFDFVSWAKNEWDTGITLENDARMAAIGCWQQGEGKGCDDFVIITLGTGIGTAVIMDGQPIRGPHGQAGILGGHQSLDPQGRECTCGNIGCAEALASTSTLPLLVKEHPDFSRSLLSERNSIDYKILLDCVRQGDETAASIWRYTIAIWSMLTVNLIHQYDPKKVIFTGGVMASGDRILPEIKKYVDRHAWLSHPMELVASQGDSDVSLYAAPYLVSTMLKKK